MPGKYKEDTELGISSKHLRQCYICCKVCSCSEEFLFQIFSIWAHPFTFQAQSFLFFTKQDITFVLFKALQVFSHFESNKIKTTHDSFEGRGHSGCSLKFPSHVVTFFLTLNSNHINFFAVTYREILSLSHVFQFSGPSACMALHFIPASCHSGSTKIL